MNRIIIILSCISTFPGVSAASFMCQYYGVETYALTTCGLLKGVGLQIMYVKGDVSRLLYLRSLLSTEEFSYENSFEKCLVTL